MWSRSSTRANRTLQKWMDQMPLSTSSTDDMLLERVGQKERPRLEPDRACVGHALGQVVAGNSNGGTGPVYERGEGR